MTLLLLSEEIRKANWSRVAPDELLFVARGGHKDVAFVSDFNDAVLLTMHERYHVMLPQPCSRQWGDECGWCSRKKWRTFDGYFWTVIDLEVDKRRVLFQRWSKRRSYGCVNDLFNIYDSHGNSVRNLVIRISRSGGSSPGYAATAINNSVFRTEQPFTKEQVLEIARKMPRYRPDQGARNPTKEGKS
jgi:hypothetical protein